MRRRRRAVRRAPRCDPGRARGGAERRRRCARQSSRRPRRDRRDACPAVVEPDTAPDPPFLSIRNYDARPAPERSPSNGLRTDYTEHGFAIRPPSVPVDVFYAIEAVAEDRSEAARLLEFLMAELTPVSTLEVGGRPLTVEWGGRRRSKENCRLSRPCTCASRRRSGLVRSRRPPCGPSTGSTWRWTAAPALAPAQASSRRICGPSRSRSITARRSSLPAVQQARRPYVPDSKQLTSLPPRPRPVQKVAAKAPRPAAATKAKTSPPAGAARRRKRARPSPRSRQRKEASDGNKIGNDVIEVDGSGRAMIQGAAVSVRGFNILTRRGVRHLSPSGSRASRSSGAPGG